jgi:hypothetical protein
MCPDRASLPRSSSAPPPRARHRPPCRVATERAAAMDLNPLLATRRVEGPRVGVRGGGENSSQMFDGTKTLAARMATYAATGRSLRRSTSGKLSTESIGFGLAVGGGLLALIAILGILFIPSATFTTLDGELFALFGVIMLAIGVVVHAAD